MVMKRTRSPGADGASSVSDDLMRVRYDGKPYATLDFAPVHSSAREYQKDYSCVPAGWELVAIAECQNRSRGQVPLGHLSLGDGRRFCALDGKRVTAWSKNKRTSWTDKRHYGVSYLVADQTSANIVRS